MKVKYGISNATAVCDDITKLPQEVIDSLDCGNFAVEQKNGKAHAYRVSYKENYDTAIFTYVGSDEIKSVIYKYKKDIKEWYYEETQTGGGSGLSVPTFTPTTFEIDLPDVDIVLSSQDCADILQNQYPIITISHAVSAEETILLTFVRNNSVSGIEKGKPFINLQYDLVADDDEDVYLVGLSFSDNDVKSWCMKINGEGGGTSAEEIYPIVITATPSSNITQIAPAQNLTMADMPDSPNYTYAPYTTLDPSVVITENYESVIVEFQAGNLYELPLISADSNMLMFGEEEQGMPVFNNYPCAVIIQINNGAIDSVMLVSDTTHAPDGTLVATSLKGCNYSNESFSLSGGGIVEADITNAIANGKIPVAIVDWKHKNYKSWCPIKVRYDDNGDKNSEFSGEYKGKELTITNDASNWSLTWETPNVKDVELIADIDYTNNKVYYRSLNNLREAQAGNKMLRLKLYDYTSHDYLGNLQLALASQSSDGTINRYTSTELVNGDVKIKTLVMSSADTLVSGSAIYIQENEYYDFNEVDLTNQTKLAEIYNLCPSTLRVHTNTDGLQMYRLQDDFRTQNSKLYYSCLLFGTLIELSITLSQGTYELGVIHYELTPTNNN